MIIKNGIQQGIKLIASAGLLTKIIADSLVGLYLLKSMIKSRN